jgi:serine/threonine protein kinase
MAGTRELMNATSKDWTRLFELYDQYFELEPRARQGWLESLADVSVATKAHLVELIGTLPNLEKSDFLGVPPAAPRAAAGVTKGAVSAPPKELSDALGQFIVGQTNLHSLRTVFREYLANHESERSSVARWLRQSAQSGRLPETVQACLNDLLTAPQDKSPPPEIKVAGVATDFVLPHLAVATPAAVVVPPSAAATVARSSVNQAATPAAEVPKLRVGMVLSDRFILVEELGHGGMGYVFKARDRWAEEAEDKNSYVAIKILGEDFRKHPDAEKALQWEARRAHTLAHPNVITVYQFNRDGPYSYMTMEYLKGRPLEALLATDFAAGTTIARTWAIVRQICAALDYGHTRVYDNKKGIVHSDLKPGNVFVCDDGCVKVLDFGISRPMPAAGKDAQTSQFDPGKRLRALTPAYASLEMWDCAPPAPSDDIYALGCITYELLTGRHPYSATDPVTGVAKPCSARDALAESMRPKRIDSLKRPQWDALKKTLALKRADRTATVGEFERGFEPKSFIKQHAVSVAIATGVVAVGALLAGARVAFKPHPWPPEPLHLHVNITAAQEKQVAEYMAEAGDNLKEATLSLSPEDLASILSDGANNVFDIVHAAQLIEPDDKSALKMQSAIATLYAKKAQMLLDAGSTAQALTLVRKGLLAKSWDHELNSMRQDICAKDPEICSPEGTSP